MTKEILELLQDVRNQREGKVLTSKSKLFSTLEEYKIIELPSPFKFLYKSPCLSDIFNDDKKLLYSLLFGCFGLVKQRPKPCAILFDISCSIGEKRIAIIKDVLKELVKDLIVFYDISFFSFSDNIYHLSDFYSHPSSVLLAVESLQEKEGFLFCDALLWVLKEVHQYMRKKRLKEGGVIVMSDFVIRGKERKNYQKFLEEIQQFAKENGIWIYPIAIQGELGIDKKVGDFLIKNFKEGIDLKEIKIQEDIESVFVEILKDLGITDKSENIEIGLKKQMKKQLSEVKNIKELLLNLFDLLCFIFEKPKIYLRSCDYSSKEFILSIYRDNGNGKEDFLSFLNKREFSFKNQRFYSFFSKEGMGMIIGAKEERYRGYIYFLLREFLYRLRELIEIEVIKQFTGSIRDFSLTKIKDIEFLRNQAAYILMEDKFLKDFPGKYILLENGKFKLAFSSLGDVLKYKEKLRDVKKVFIKKAEKEGEIIFPL